jgi:hypothetical protein
MVAVSYAERHSVPTYLRRRANRPSPTFDAAFLPNVAKSTGHTLWRLVQTALTLLSLT